MENDETEYTREELEDIEADKYLEEYKEEKLACIFKLRSDDKNGK